MPVAVSMKLAVVCTVTLVVTGVPLALWLSQSRSLLRVLVRATVMVPLVLPPSVLGFYFLIAFSPTSFSGAFLAHFAGLRLSFTFEGLAVASVFAGLPFMVNPVLAGFESLPKSLGEASEVLGKSRTETLIRVLLPSIRPSLIAGIVMTFIHTFGEFGLVLMLGGKIPGKTQTVSIALYDYVESLNFTQAHVYAAVLVVCSIGALFALFRCTSVAPGRPA
jgi:molybdate transport system permease protein